MFFDNELPVLSAIMILFEVWAEKIWGLSKGLFQASLPNMIRP